MRKYLIILTLTALLSTTLLSYGQVSIGLSEKPVEGALLQLKNVEPTNNSSINSTKGLLMPRVGLTEISKLYPMYDYIENAPSATDKRNHTGLLVMNTTTNEMFCAGLYVWDGEHWTNVKETEISYYTDTRTSNVDGKIETNIYPTQEFGDAGTWMLTNLRTTLLPDGTPINLLPDAGTTIGSNDLFYYYPPKEQGPINFEVDRVFYQANPYLGYLYTWNAATGGTKTTINYNEGAGAALAINTSEATNGVQNLIPANIEAIGNQGICPNGWHLPSDVEMNQLEKYISNSGTKYYDNSEEPSYILETWNDEWDIVVWETDNTHSRGNAGKSMMSSYYNNGGLSRQICEGVAGFSAYIVGFVAQGVDTGGNTVGESRGRKILGDYWTSSKATNTDAWYRSFILAYDSAGEKQYPGATRNWAPTKNMMSIRCKKN